MKPARDARCELWLTSFRAKNALDTIEANHVISNSNIKSFFRPAFDDTQFSLYIFPLRVHVFGLPQCYELTEFQCTKSFIDDALIAIYAVKFSPKSDIQYHFHRPLYK
jgi:hypothetical protein